LLSGSSTPIKTKYELQQITGDIEISYQMGWMLDAGCWILDTRCWMLDAGYSIFHGARLKTQGIIS